MYYIGPIGISSVFQQVKRRVEEREAEQVAAMMNMVPPWQESWPEPPEPDRPKFTHSRWTGFWGSIPFDEQMECNDVLFFSQVLMV